MSIGNQIAQAHQALAPEQAARIIYAGLFETGPNRLDAKMKYVAIQTITGALVEWRQQLLTSAETEAGKYKKLYEDAKAQLDEVRLKYAILKKES